MKHSPRPSRNFQTNSSQLNGGHKPDALLIANSLVFSGFSESGERRLALCYATRRRAGGGPVCSEGHLLSYAAISASVTSAESPKSCARTVAYGHDCERAEESLVEAEQLFWLPPSPSYRSWDQSRPKRRQRHLFTSFTRAATARFGSGFRCHGSPKGRSFTSAIVKARSVRGRTIRLLRPEPFCRMRE